jgi:transcriptional antiterminator/mannitol/fructose-specific phosphotransferase system IIA component (Ntr-type)
MSREEDVTRLLLESDGFLSYENLANHFQVSTRTIRSDINKIEERLSNQGISLVRDRSKGVRIDRPRSESAGRVYAVPDSWSPEYRQSVIMWLLLSEQVDLSVKAIANAIGASRSTAESDLQSCISRLALDGINVSHRPYHPIHISYQENAFRETVVRLILSMSGMKTTGELCHFLDVLELRGPNDSEKVIREFTSRNDLTIASDLLHRYERQAGIEFSDEALLNLSLYICVLSRRIREGHRIDESVGIAAIASDSASSASACHGLAELSEGIGKAFGIAAPLSDCERKYLDRRIAASQNLRLDSSGIGFYEQSLVHDFVAEVERRLRVNLTDDERLYENLLIHIVPTIHRIVFGIRVVNPLKDEVLSQLHEVYSACKEASGIFERAFEAHISDDEVSYLTLHVAASIEKSLSKETSSHKTAIVVCSSGVGTSSLLMARLRTVFPNLQVRAVCRADEIGDADLTGIDCILTTTPLSVSLPIPIILVSPLIDEIDVMGIEQKIHAHAMSMNDDVVDRIASRVADEFGIQSKHSLKDVIRGEMLSGSSTGTGLMASSASRNALDYLLTVDQVRIIRNREIGWEEAIAVAGEILHRCGFAELRYTDAMRDSLIANGSYSVFKTGVMLAHARPEEGAIRPGLSFVIPRSPIAFPGTDVMVRLVIGLCARDETESLPIMEGLLKLINGSNKVQEWTSVPSEEAFVTFGRRCLRESETA